MSVSSQAVSSPAVSSQADEDESPVDESLVEEVYDTVNDRGGFRPTVPADEVKDLVRLALRATGITRETATPATLMFVAHAVAQRAAELALTAGAVPGDHRDPPLRWRLVNPSDVFERRKTVIRRIDPSLKFSEDRVVVIMVVPENDSLMGYAILDDGELHRMALQSFASLFNANWPGSQVFLPVIRDGWLQWVPLIELWNSTSLDPPTRGSKNTVFMSGLCNLLRDEAGGADRAFIALVTGRGKAPEPRRYPNMATLTACIEGACAGQMTSEFPFLRYREPGQPLRDFVEAQTQSVLYMGRASAAGVLRICGPPDAWPNPVEEDEEDEEAEEDEEDEEAEEAEEAVVSSDDELTEDEAAGPAEGPSGARGS